MEVVYFIYGLSFFSLALTIFSQPRLESQLEIRNLIWMLGAFALIHGIQEWAGLWKLARGDSPAVDVFESISLFVSFVFLFEFGRRLTLSRPVPDLIRKFLGKPVYSVVVAGFLFEYIRIPSLMLATTISSRYCLCFAGSSLTSLGFLLYSDVQRSPRSHALSFPWSGRYFLLAAFAFASYGVFGGLVVEKVDVFPANLINDKWFLSTFDVPVQMFRSACAVLAAISIATITRIFHREAEGNIKSALQVANERNNELLSVTHQLELEIQARRELELGILKISEEEKAHLGRDLHDDLGQLLSGIAYSAGALATRLETTDPLAGQQAGEIKRATQDAIKHARHISHGLIPFQSGLRQLLEQLAVDTTLAYGIPCTARLDRNIEITDFMVSTHLYRIAQEAVNNAVKHSRPTRIDIGLIANSDAITLAIADNGIGLPRDAQELELGQGLMNMRYRASTIGAILTLDSHENKGTTISVSLPRASQPTAS